MIDVEVYCMLLGNEIRVRYSNNSGNWVVKNSGQLLSSTGTKREAVSIAERKAENSDGAVTLVVETRKGKVTRLSDIDII